MSRPQSIGGATPAGAATEGGRVERDGLRLFAASNRNLLPRVITAAVAAIGMLPFLSWVWVVPWFLLIVGIPLAGILQTQAADRNPKLRKTLSLRLMIGTVASGALYAVITVAMFHSHNPAAAIFALAMNWISLVYVLMQYYAEPRVFAVAVSPYLIAMGWMGFDVGLICLRNHKPWGILTLIAIAGLIANFVIMARRQLAASRAQLRQARALAQEREAAAEEANRAKSTFLATMSHEIRTPAERGPGHGSGPGGRRPVAGPTRPGERDPRIRRGAAGHPQRRARPCPRSRPASWSWKRRSSIWARSPAAPTRPSPRSPTRRAVLRPGHR